MKLHRIDLHGAVDDAEDFERAAYAIGVQGVELLDAESGLPDGRIAVRLYVPSGRDAAIALQALRSALPGARIESSDVEYVGAVRARPILLGRRFRIGEPLRPSPTRTTLLLDRETTFGDGSHPTTRLVVEALEEHVVRRRHRRALDVGTGTGVLTLVALELGVHEVVATDVDPLARKAARDAIARHGLRARGTVRTTLPREAFPLVLANLYRDLLLGMIEELASRVAAGGLLVVSGFGPPAATLVRRRFEAEGLELVARRSRRGWTALVLRRGRPRTARGR